VLGEVEARMVFFAFGNSTLSVVGFAASESEPHAGPSVFPVCSRDESVCRNERKDLEARRVVRVACSRTLLPDAAKGYGASPEIVCQGTVAAGTGTTLPQKRYSRLPP
jgi:hypothetical protein